MMTLRLIITGGTIDGFVDAKSSIHTSSLPQILAEAAVTAPIILEELMLKDSRDLTDADRERLLLACKESPEERIVMTHGTMTMVTTARFLGERMTEKTIVLTGALIPFSHNHSDAAFNVGFALAATQYLPHGVYVAMNGNVFLWNDVCKNEESGTFEQCIK